MGKDFEKIKAKAVARIGPVTNDWYKAQVDKINALNDFPVDNNALRHVPVRAKILFLRAELAAKFPGVKFSVIKDSYHSIRVTVKSAGADLDAIKKVAGKYEHAGNTDIMTDYFDYDNYVFVGEDIEIPNTNGAKGFAIVGGPVVI